MNVLVSQLSHREIYGILLNTVAPRPIAWVSSLGASGQPNLAPFSFFNCVSVDPPMLAFSPGLHPRKDAEPYPHGEPKTHCVIFARLKNSS
jgi:flavin reductase (DIM6/NTAB) family NADH-FMN oxidoreductase RutF